MSPATQQRVQDLLAYLAASFPESSLDETFESVETDAVFIGVNRRGGKRLFVGVSGPAMTHAKEARLSEIAASLNLTAALGRASENERIWIDVGGPKEYRLCATNKDDHSPEHGKPIP